jgi:hypothetical protein
MKIAPLVANALCFGSCIYCLVTPPSPHDGVKVLLIVAAACNAFGVYFWLLIRVLKRKPE